MEINYSRRKSSNHNKDYDTIEIGCKDTTATGESMEDCYKRLQSFVDSKIEKALYNIHPNMLKELVDLLRTSQEWPEIHKYISRTTRSYNVQKITQLNTSAMYVMYNYLITYLPDKNAFKTDNTDNND